MSLLQMSVSAGVMIVVITIIRALAINRLPKKTFLVLWGIVLIRLLVPFSCPSPLSVYSLVNHQGAGQISGTPAVNILPIVPATNDFTIATTVTQTTELSLWALIWGIGAALCALYFAIAYIRCRREFRTSQPVENSFTAGWLLEHKCGRPITIRQTADISAPLTYGIFRPIILMPNEMDWTDTRKLHYVLTHEYVHIQRFDGLTKLLLTAALCIHWFNPLVWIMYILANRDIENVCDEKVVQIFGETIKSAYALALIGMEEKKSGFTPLYNHFSKSAIEERIKLIMVSKQTGRIGKMLAFALVIIIPLTFATSAIASVNQSTMLSTSLSQLMSKYEPYGIKYEIGDTDTLKMYYNGQPINGFIDYVSDDGSYIGWFFNHNCDSGLFLQGKYENGIVIGVQSMPEFLVNQAFYSYDSDLDKSMPNTSGSNLATSKDNPYVDFEQFGIKYDADNHLMYYNSELVQGFVGEIASNGSYHNWYLNRDINTGLFLQGKYKSNKLAGIEIMPSVLADEVFGLSDN